MKFRRITVLLAGAALAAATAAAAPSASASPQARPGSLGPGWTATQLVAYSGGGCAVPSSDSNLAAVVSGACNSWIWYYRNLGPVPNHGEEVELVDTSGSYAMTFRAGQWKMATPSDSSTYVVFETNFGCSGGYCLFDNPGFTNYGTPNGKGLPLKTPGSASAPAGAWLYPLP